MKKRGKPRAQKRTTHYTLMQEICASATEPLPQFWRTTQLTSMWDGLAQLETNPTPDTDDWRVCSDAVNLLETLVEMGEVEDTAGLLMDAITALAEAGKRHMKEGKPLRLSGTGMQAVRAVLTDYSEVLELLPARTMIRAHRLTEQRLHAIFDGKRKPHDVEVMAI